MMPLRPSFISRISKQPGQSYAGLVMEGKKKLAAVENEIAQEYCEKWQGIDCGPEPVADWFRTRFNVSLSSHLIQNGLVYDTIEIAASGPKSRRSIMK
jgi:hypothetical protein